MLKIFKLIFYFLKTYFIYFLVLILSFIIKLISKNISNKTKSITCFLYGGIGDQLIIIERLNSLSDQYNIKVYLDYKFKFLSDFLKTKNIIFYRKKNKFNFIKSIIKDKKTNQIYFSNSANYIHLIIYLIGNFSSFIGYLGNFDKIMYGSEYYKTNQKNRYASIKIICEHLIKKDLEKFDFDLKKISNKVLEISKSKPYIILNIFKTNYWGDVSLPLNVWKNFIIKNTYLNKLNIILVGDNSQIHKSEEFYKLISSLNVINLTGKTDFYELGFLISLSKLVICNDTGIMHLSNFCKKKNLSIFTFSDPEVYANNAFTSNLFKQKYKCQPCISISKIGCDNHPPLCFNNYNCAKTITEDDLEIEFNNFLEAKENNF